MILEHAILPVRSGSEEEFEAVFPVARQLIESSPGFIGLTLQRGIESPSQYLLLVEWESVEAHQVGFRESPAYQEWRSMLHHFYEPFPIVEHYRPITEG
jgi:heme-degrading monooxygenase HmoA